MTTQFLRFFKNQLAIVLVAVTLTTGPAFANQCRSLFDSKLTNSQLSTPLQSNAIEVEELQEANYSKFAVCGVCDQIQRLHMRAFVIPLLRHMGLVTHQEHAYVSNRAAISAGKFVVIRHLNEVIGIVKILSAEQLLIAGDGKFKTDPDDVSLALGTPTFLALRDVMNDEGKKVLETGRAYFVSREFYQSQLEPQVNSQGPFLYELKTPNFWEASGNLRRFYNDFAVGTLDVKEMSFAEGPNLSTRSLPNRLQALLKTAFARTNSHHTPTEQGDTFKFLLRLIQKRLTVESGTDPKLLNLRNSIFGEFERADLGSAENFELSL